MKMKQTGGRRKRRLCVPAFLLLFTTTALLAGTGLFFLSLRFIDPTTGMSLPAVNDWKESVVYDRVPVEVNTSVGGDLRFENEFEKNQAKSHSSCATVEQMGKVFTGVYWNESLRVRSLIRDHFLLHGAPTLRKLPPEKFCKQSFVLAKASEAGFGNEMYKILTGAALSVMLKRSLIIGQTRHIGSFSSLSPFHPLVCNFIYFIDQVF